MKTAALCGPIVGATLAVAMLAGSGAGLAQAPIVVNVGAASTTSDAPIYIADKKGYFREEGLEAKVTNFRSAADMVAPLGIGQLDAGAGSASAGLYNAMLQGIKIKIVADKASSAPDTVPPRFLSARTSSTAAVSRLSRTSKA
jgi:NitT/TauT family transport system substrate-binding protein